MVHVYGIAVSTLQNDNIIFVTVKQVWSREQQVICVVLVEEESDCFKQLTEFRSDVRLPNNNYNNNNNSNAIYI